MIKLGLEKSFYINDVMIDLVELDYKRQLKYQTSSHAQIHAIAGKYAYIDDTRWRLERGKEISEYEQKTILKKYYELLEMLQ
jgi:hypothetical protein